MTSKYASNVSALVRSLHFYLVNGLSLPDPFRSTDPNIGEKYGLLAARDYSEGEGGKLNLACTFLASAAFTDYWHAQSWAIETGLNLDNLLATAKRSVNTQGVLGDFTKSGTISVGNPRSPLQKPQGQVSHIWVVDVLCPCRIELLIYTDPICGHR